MRAQEQGMTEKPKLWVTRRLSDATLERAARDYDAIINYGRRLSSDDELVAMSAKVDAIIPCHSEHFTAEVANSCDPRLKIIANHSVGVDHCDLPALEGARHRGHQHAGCAFRRHGRNRHAADAGRRTPCGRGRPSGAVRQLGFLEPVLHGRQTGDGRALGIIGMGRVGQAFARKARGFDMDIHYYNRSRLAPHQEHGATYHASVESLLGMARLPVAALPGDT
jgi:lactate dehydrogenase-like 2-hydroxyacid dehydrogenase